MACYVALLASINVGGNRLKMSDLKSALESGGLQNVSTVVSSGNVLFDHPDASSDAMEEQIAACVKENFDIDTFAAVCSKADLEKLVLESPFAESGDEKLVHVHFFETEPDSASLVNLLADHEGRGEEQIAPGSRALHINYVNGVGRSKLTGDFMERRMGCRGTARNLSSIRRIIGKMD